MHFRIDLKSMPVLNVPVYDRLTMHGRIVRVTEGRFIHVNDILAFALLSFDQTLFFDLQDPALCLIFICSTNCDDSKMRRMLGALSCAKYASVRGLVGVRILFEYNESDYFELEIDMKRGAKIEKKKENISCFSSSISYLSRMDMLAEVCSVKQKK